MERPIDRRRWIYAVTVRRVDLHPWPALICPLEGNWCLDALDAPTMADLDTGREPLGEGERRMRFISDGWEGNDLRLSVVMSLYYFKSSIMGYCNQQRVRYQQKVMNSLRWSINNFLSGHHLKGPKWKLWFQLFLSIQWMPMGSKILTFIERTKTTETFTKNVGWRISLKQWLVRKVFVYWVSRLKRRSGETSPMDQTIRWCCQSVVV